MGLVRESAALFSSEFLRLMSVWIGHGLWARAKLLRSAVKCLDEPLKKPTFPADYDHTAVVWWPSNVTLYQGNNVSGVRGGDWRLYFRVQLHLVQIDGEDIDTQAWDIFGLNSPP